MTCLLDTHAFLWWIGPYERLSLRAHQAVSDGGDVYVSAVSIWELAIKTRIGSITVADDFRARITAELEANDFQVLPVELEHTLAVHDLPDHPKHKDPFDRLLAAQSLVEKVPLVSRDRVFDDYGVDRLW
ncbi:MAG: type II toxin-antitoxin system VapC family toxin [Acidobacteriota bacterium]|nr:type II toxin-antitoxin system VapC family toxin [Acidobacteriota bacterium]